MFRYSKNCSYFGFVCITIPNLHLLLWILLSLVVAAAAVVVVVAAVSKPTIELGTDPNYANTLTTAPFLSLSLSTPSSCLWSGAMALICALCNR